jgi:hypothetical protein
MLAQHTPYNYGLADIGRDFLYRQFAQLSRCTPEREEDQPWALHAAVGAARLAPRVRDAGGLRAALRHYRRALRLTIDPVVEADLIYGIANLYAHQRHPAALAQARLWYERGYDVLRQITKSEDKAYVEIRLTNGLALVEYHQGRSEEALALEQHAQSVALSVKVDHPHVERWATPIINANTAKLLEKRFADLPSAIKLLEVNLAANEPLIRENARIDLARLYFDQGNHHRVVDLLSSLYDEAYPIDLDEQQELFGRLMFSLALSIIGDITRTRRQLGRLTYLLHAVGTQSARQLLAAIDQSAEECSMS